MRRRWVNGLKTVVVTATFAAAALSGHALALTQDNPQGFVVEPNCQVNVAVGDHGSIPVAAIQAVVDNGGTVLVERNAPYLFQLTVNGWSLHEDADQWGDLRDFEVECSTLIPFSR